MKQFEALFDGVGFKKGTAIDFSASGRGKLVTKVDGKQVRGGKRARTLTHTRTDTRKPTRTLLQSTNAGAPNLFKPPLFFTLSPMHDNQHPQVGTIESPELVKALFGIYLGSDPVSPDAKAGFAQGLAALLAE